LDFFSVRKFRRYGSSNNIRLRKPASEIHQKIPEEYS